MLCILFLFQTTILVLTITCVCVLFKSLPHAYKKDSCIFDMVPLELYGPQI